MKAKCPTKRPTTREKLEALKRGVELPVNLDLMQPGDYAGPDERAVLTLARVYEAAIDPDYSVISRASQEKAEAFFNAHGLLETLDECLRVGGPSALD
jgi:hypothetical protein